MTWESEPVLCTSNFAADFSAPDSPTEKKVFSTGAWRGGEAGKFDFEGFFSPLVLERRAQYMQLHRTREDGAVRAGDNWQKGMPQKSYMQSGWRHFFDWWKLHRYPARRPHQDYLLEEAICALMFNCEGYLHEILKKKDAKLKP